MSIKSKFIKSQNSELIIKKKITAVLNYNQILQSLIKKGNKHSIECILKKSLMFKMKQGNPLNIKQILENAFLYTRPYVSVYSKRKGSKNIYIPFKLTENRSKFLATKWILANILIKQNNNLFERIFEELYQCSLKTSTALKKCEDLHKLAEDSLINLKRKF